MAEPQEKLEADLEKQASFELGEDSVEITLPSGETLNVDLSALSELGLDSEDLSTYHAYTEVHAVQVWDQIHAQDDIWRNLQEDPAPSFGLSASDMLQQTGDTSSVPGLGSVTHHIDSDQRVVANVTNPDHQLHPGVVMRAPFEHEGQHFILTIGFGNGAMPRMNEYGADHLWGEARDALQRETIFEQVQGDEFRQAQAIALDPEKLHEALRGPMNEEFLSTNPEIAALKTWVDAQGMSDALACGKFVETYDELMDQGSYRDVVRAVQDHLETQSEPAFAPEISAPSDEAAPSEASPTAVSPMVP